MGFAIRECGTIFRRISGSEIDQLASYLFYILVFTLHRKSLL